jgi:sterol desaturase/sphingolipid hydroxylase (fatty acid hydroxylase superfamily)
MYLGKVLYFADFVLCPAVFLCAAAFEFFSLSPVFFGVWLLNAGAGAAAWTLIEYVLHRWAFHHVRWFRRYHELHHEKPNSHVGAPSFFFLPASISLIFVPVSRLSPLAASGLTGGVILGYTSYILVHHASHFYVGSRGSYFYRTRLRHLRHHFGDPNGNFGVTTGIWDRLFGTALERPARPSNIVTSR